jgi:hypothetical protein
MTMRGRRSLPVSDRVMGKGMDMALVVMVLRQTERALTALLTMKMRPTKDTVLTHPTAIPMVPHHIHLRRLESLVVQLELLILLIPLILLTLLTLLTTSNPPTKDMDITHRTVIPTELHHTHLRRLDLLVAHPLELLVNMAPAVMAQAATHLHLQHPKTKAKATRPPMLPKRDTAAP